MPAKPLRLFAVTIISKETQFSRANRVEGDFGFTLMVSARSLKEAKESAFNELVGWGSGIVEYRALVKDLGTYDRIVEAKTVETVTTETAPKFRNGREA